jgi:hypothetical protein
VNDVTPNFSCWFKILGLLSIINVCRLHIMYDQEFLNKMSVRGGNGDGVCTVSEAGELDWPCV